MKIFEGSGWRKQESHFPPSWDCSINWFHEDRLWSKIVLQTVKEALWGCWAQSMRLRSWWIPSLKNQCLGFSLLEMTSLIKSDTHQSGVMCLFLSLSLPPQLVWGPVLDFFFKLTQMHSRKRWWKVFNFFTSQLGHTSYAREELNCGITMHSWNRDHKQQAVACCFLGMVWSGEATSGPLRAGLGAKTSFLRKRRPLWRGTEVLVLCILSLPEMIFERLPAF